MAATTKKDWVDSFSFREVPTDIYNQYDEMRMFLVDELNQLIKDSMAENETLKIIKRLQPIGIEFMELLNKTGMLHSDQLDKPENIRFKEVLVRCKAHSVAVPVRKGTQYWYDLTDLGMTVLNCVHASKDGNIATVEARQP